MINRICTAFMAHITPRCWKQHTWHLLARVCVCVVKCTVTHSLRNTKYVCVCLCTLSFVMVSQSSIYSYIIEHMVCDHNGCSLTECVMVSVLTCADWLCASDDSESFDVCVCVCVHVFMKERWKQKAKDVIGFQEKAPDSYSPHIPSFWFSLWQIPLFSSFATPLSPCLSHSLSGVAVIDSALWWRVERERERAPLLFLWFLIPLFSSALWLSFLFFARCFRWQSELIFKAD